MAEKIFVEGLFFKEPNEKVKNFIKANLSFNVVKFTEWLQKQTNERGYVNVDVKVGKTGSIYCELNTWKPQAKVPVIQEGQSFDEQMKAPAQEPTKVEDENEINIKDIPFG